MTNPLLNPFILPPFSKIQYKHIMPAIIQILKNRQIIVEKILSQQINYNWDNMMYPIEEINDCLNKVFSLISHLNTVIDNPELREIYKQICALILQSDTWMLQNKKLYEAYLFLKEKNYALLDDIQKKYITKVLKNFKLSGIDLDKYEQEKYCKIVNRLSEIEIIYSNNLLDASMGWEKLVVKKKELSGISKNILTKIREKSNNKEGWVLTLNFPIYLSVLTCCNNSKLRKEIYLAYSTRASDQGPNAHQWDNSDIINEQLLLRYKLAKLLGFKSFADKSLVDKAAKKPKKVINFLYILLDKIYKKAKEEIAELKFFIKKKYGVHKLNPWDFAYYSQKQKKYLYKFKDEELRSYFPETIVLSGLFELINRLYGVTVIKRTNADVYHPDIVLFDILNKQKDLLGSFYIDIYARKNKCSGAWMNTCVNRMRKINGNIQKPVAYIICNFNHPDQNKPALLTHNEVIILFHEFGHCLHHILTTIDVPGVSGINGVPLDIIEFPSQFMENWCWEPEIISLISGHYKTGKPIPSNILNNLLKTKNYQKAIFILRQLEFSLFDINIHYNFHPQKNKNVLEILKNIRNRISILPYVKEDRFPNSFNHIFSGCYAAGYYSYLWASVLAADAYARFKEDGIFNKETGKSFLENILMRGSSEDFDNMFKRFRGHEPSIQSLLKQYEISL
ncbi:oligopeptidase A [Candidatus Pantoea edessiphila]|uniref:oligopeptidase A n=1 Tax=Candidatus Pantoea edessiphila TaxID=2044610 RepID=A0A2P5SZM0_9GAMM|nr:oligopeptidase A [Candidatus Pantoea edessiphila]PPI87788.1 oligopeptidase A [Candidatus Pantoea edessiphila]